MVKAAVCKKWTEKLHVREAAEEMSTMEFFTIQACSLGQLHPVWQGLHNPLSTLKATDRAQLLIKRYPLSTSHTAGSNEKDLCPLCKQVSDITTHFLIHCSARAETKHCSTLAGTRRSYINTILDGCHSLMVSVNQSRHPHLPHHPFVSGEQSDMPQSHRMVY